VADIEDSTNSNQEALEEKIKSLETRLSKIESILRIQWIEKSDEIEGPIPAEKSKASDPEHTTESRIVEYGLAWLGSIVFFFGVIFLMSYIEGLGYPVLAKVTAYFLTLSVIAFSIYSKNSFPTLTYVLNICSVLLLFYITVGLHFFSDQPLIAQKGVGLALAFGIIGLWLYKAIKSNAEFLATIAIALSVITAVISDYSYITFAVLLITAIASHLLFYHKVWWRLHIFSLFMVYLAHLLWLLNNPVLGHEMRAVGSPDYNMLFLFGYAVTYSLSVFIPKERLGSNGSLISIAIWNAISYSFLLLLVIPIFYEESYPLVFSAVTAYCLIFSIVLKIKSKQDFAPATYASFGFAALSIAVYGFFGLPNVFLLLVLQSVLVVLIAIWYRSRIIVVANTFLFVSILLIYLIISGSVNITNFSFALAALATARILHWRKDQLTLKTDIIRNMYLLLACAMILYGLNQALPRNYVTMAWTATAIGFFLLSIIFGNIKYRYLSILTIVITGGHLFFVDLGQLDILYRVIAFLSFAMITLGVSLYYTKKIRNK